MIIVEHLLEDLVSAKVREIPTILRIPVKIREIEVSRRSGLLVYATRVGVSAILTDRNVSW